MPSPKPRIVFSKVIPALKADRHGVITIQYGLNNSAASEAAEHRVFWKARSRDLWPDQLRPSFPQTLQ